MKLQVMMWRLVLGGLILCTGCIAPPPREGFTNIAIANSRQSLATPPGSAKTAHWDSLDLTMLDRSDVILATLKGVTVSLTPGQDADGKANCRALVTATLSATEWCTSPTYNQGLGQVLQLYFEKGGHALVLPWTLGAVKIEAGGASQTLSYEKTLDAKILNDVIEVEIRIQPCLWKQCQ